MELMISDGIGGGDGRGDWATSSALRDAHSKLNPSDRLRCAYQVASGVEALHRSGTCHLRLAAHNVWVAVDGKEMRCAVVNAAVSALKLENPDDPNRAKCAGTEILRQ